MFAARWPALGRGFPPRRSRRETESDAAPTNLLASSVRAATADAVPVPTTTLREALEDRGFGRCTLICDIEGGERELVRHESETLGRSVDTLILELYERLLGRDKTTELLHELRRVGFEIVGRSWETLALKNTRLGPRRARRC